MQTPSQKLVYFFCLFYIAWIIRATVFYTAVDLSIPSETARLVFSNFIKFLLWVVPTVLCVVYVEKQNPLKTLKITAPVDWRGFVIGLGISVLYFTLIFGSERWISKRTLTPLLQVSPIIWLAMFARVFFSPISEEILFRGFALPRLNERFSFWQTNTLQAILFTAIHWPNWLWINSFQAWMLATSIGIFLLGLFLGWLFRRTNSIWPPIAAHIANNFLTAFLG
jgi:uncharacterized protein